MHFALQEKEVDLAFVANFLTGPPPLIKSEQKEPSLILHRKKGHKLETEGKAFRKLFYEHSHSLKGVLHFYESNEGSPAKRVRMLVEGREQGMDGMDGSFPEAYEKLKREVEEGLCR